MRSARSPLSVGLHIASCLLVVCLVAAGSTARAADDAPQSPLAGWQSGVTVSPVLGRVAAHSMHSYFNTSPESPDGKWVLLYRSTAADGHRGEVCLVERATGNVRVLAEGIETEDAHRVACQQWSCGGREVVFHDLREGRWTIVAVNVETGESRELAKDRQLCWGQAAGEVVPLYGPHWAPGEHRDLELLNVRTGDITTALTWQRVKSALADSAPAEFFGREFGEHPISVFFPILSPDGNRVLFKIATPASGVFRSKGASNRHGIVCYDLKSNEFGYIDHRWGHPAWHPNSRQLINMAGTGVVIIDSVTGKTHHHKDLPKYPGSHPSLSPDGKLFVTDTRIPDLDRDRQQTWGVSVGDYAGGESVMLHRLDNARGARSWRVSHPHPVFSPDGRRIYFNVSADQWTRL